MTRVCRSCKQMNSISTSYKEVETTWGTCTLAPSSRRRLSALNLVDLDVPLPRVAELREPFVEHQPLALAHRLQHILQKERQPFSDNLLVRIHCIIEMIWWTGLAPWVFEFRVPGSLMRTQHQPLALAHRLQHVLQTPWAQYPAVERIWHTYRCTSIIKKNNHTPRITVGLWA